MPRLVYPLLLVPAILAQAGVWLWLVAGWRQLVRVRLGRESLLGSALVQFALFSFGKYLPGKVWGAAARAVDMRRDGVETAESVDLTIFEQYLVLHSALILCCLLVPLVIPGYWAWLLALAAVATAPLGAGVVDLVLPRLLSLLNKADVPRRHTVGPAVVLGLLGRYAMAWALHGIVLVMLFAALSEGLAGLDPRTISLLVLGNTIGMVAGFAAVFAPAGLGVREAAMAAVLATGMSVPEAISLSVAMRLWTVATDIGFGGLALLARRQS